MFPPSNLELVKCALSNLAESRRSTSEEQQRQEANQRTWRRSNNCLSAQFFVNGWIIPQMSRPF